MTDLTTFDPALFGAWPSAPAYEERDAADGWSAGKVRLQAQRVLETKSIEPPREELRHLLNDMTREMREQFDYFRKLRGAADALCDAGADEAAGKLARADVKAATDAMSLIVRTLERVDSLQRQLARDRELEAERRAQTPAYEDARARFLRQIETRASEIARLLFEEWKRGGTAGSVADGEVEAAEPGGAPGRDEDVAEMRERSPPD